MSLGLTIAWEAGVVLGLLGGDAATRRRVLAAIVSANLWTLLLVSVVGAIIALPHRLDHAEVLYPPPSS